MPTISRPAPGQLEAKPLLEPPLLSTDATAILLLCGRFGERRPGIKPLTQSEYHDLDGALENQKLTPGSLLDETKRGFLKTEGAGVASPERLMTLLARSDELERALDNWTSAGIWVLSERDRDYPQRLRQRLTSARPPLLFGAGPKEPLDHGGVCIVGSRDSPKPALEFAQALGAQCAREGLSVISSDMRGVDREAISAALAKEGPVISVLSDSLEKTISQRRNRDALASGLLTLATPFSPETRFTVANAMRANKFQYALSDAAVIVETRRKGGIWSGADENRKEGWVPAFVRVGESMSQGNGALLHLGLFPIAMKDVESGDNLRDFFLSYALKHRDLGETAMTNSGMAATTNDIPPLDLYSVFLTKFLSLAAHRPHSEEEIMNLFNIKRSQAREWLGRAVEEGRVKKYKRPVRYGALRAVH